MLFRSNDTATTEIYTLSLHDALPILYTINSASSDVELWKTLYQFDKLHIRPNEWHMLSNETDKPLKITEIQWGQECVETDIERHDHYDYK